MANNKDEGYEVSLHIFCEMGRREYDDFSKTTIWGDIFDVRDYIYSRWTEMGIGMGGEKVTDLNIKIHKLG